MYTFSKTAAVWRQLLVVVPLFFGASFASAQGCPDPVVDGPLDIDFRNAPWDMAAGMKSYRPDGLNLVVEAKAKLGHDPAYGLGAGKDTQVTSNEEFRVFGFRTPELLSAVCVSQLEEGDSGTIAVTYLADPSDPSVTNLKEFDVVWSGSNEQLVKFEVGDLDDGLLVKEAVFISDRKTTGMSVAGFKVSESVKVNCAPMGGEEILCETTQAQLWNTIELKGVINNLDRYSEFEGDFKIKQSCTFEDHRSRCACDPATAEADCPDAERLLLDFATCLATPEGEWLAPPQRGLRQAIISGDYCGVPMTEGDIPIIRAAEIDSAFVQRIGERIETTIENVVEPGAEDCRLQPDDHQVLWLPQAYIKVIVGEEPPAAFEVPVIDMNGEELQEMLPVTTRCNGVRSGPRYSFLAWNVQLEPELRLPEADTPSLRDIVLDTIDLAVAVTEQTSNCTTNGDATSQVASNARRVAFWLEREDYENAISETNDFISKVNDLRIIEGMASCFWDLEQDIGANPYLNDTPDADTGGDSLVPGGYNALLDTLGKDIRYQICSRLAFASNPGTCDATWTGAELNATCRSLRPLDCFE